MSVSWSQSVSLAGGGVGEDGIRLRNLCSGGVTSVVAEWIRQVWNSWDCPALCCLQSKSSFQHSFLYIMQVSLAGSLSCLGSISWQGCETVMQLCLPADLTILELAKTLLLDCSFFVKLFLQTQCLHILFLNTLSRVGHDICKKSMFLCAPY